MENVNWTTKTFLQKEKHFNYRCKLVDLVSKQIKVLKKGSHYHDCLELVERNEALEAIKKENPNAKLDLMQLTSIDFIQ